MRKIREVLRLRLEVGLSIRQISASTKTSVGAIQKLLSRFDALNLGWPLPETLDDNHLAALFYPGADTAASTRYLAPCVRIVVASTERVKTRDRGREAMRNAPLFRRA